MFVLFYNEWRVKNNKKNNTDQVVQKILFTIQYTSYNNAFYSKTII